MRDVLTALVETLDAGREALLCQVAETKGSTPQKAGALMLVRPNGGQVGTLGGGCVENEVKLAACRRVGIPGAEKITTILDHDYAWADGLICGGKMTFLAETLQGPEAAQYYRVYDGLLAQGDGLTEAIVIDPEKAGIGPFGARHLFDHEGRWAAGWPSPEGRDAIASRIEPASPRSRPTTIQGVAILPIFPRIRLVIVGGGHIGQAVAALAAQADFDVWVVDDREAYANPERFPTAQRLVVGPLDEVLPTLEVNSRTFALVVTRGHGHDQEALYYLAPTPAPHIGMIGSRRKVRLIFDGLREQGVSEQALARISAPVGFAIGSQTVIEIAISIVAELIARRNLGVPRARPAAEPSVVQA